MFRKLIVSLFIFTSLSAQASTVFACKMMNQVRVAHCCCHDDDGSMQKSAGDQTCCDEITLVSDHDGASSSATTTKLPVPDFQSQPVVLVAADFVLPNVVSGTPWWSDPPHITQRSGSLTYLRTQRLRI